MIRYFDSIDSQMTEFETKFGLTNASMTASRDPHFPIVQNCLGRCEGARGRPDTEVWVDVDDSNWPILGATGSGTVYKEWTRLRDIFSESSKRGIAVTIDKR